MIAAAIAAPAWAAPPAITWGSATTIAGDTDVSTTGTLLYAYNVGWNGTTGGPSGATGTPVSAVTVNGVTFSAFGMPGGLYPPYLQTVTVGSVTMTESPGFLWSKNDLGLATGLSTDYRTLLASGGGATNPATITVSLGGLTSGRQYQLQLWSNNSGNANLDPQTAISNTVVSSTVTLDSNTTNAAGGVGQYVIGSFTAGSTSINFTLNGSGTGLGPSPLINAFQVRDITAIPGPGGLALALGLGAAGSGGRRRRR
ncbi:MAG: hypothetical protein FGM39_02875 [Phycisphaerales bacterium]|nr:hypothetical protein [Phycisphaerales bacterium]